ncbi:MAG TPA: tRNA pseudouridine synthase A [Gaiellales bacterium]|nr:tRNA pseudouridine synthase A [Gaiellales bacterium]
MATYRLTVGYDGTDFHGWAPQPGLRTVAGELAAAVGVPPGDLTVAGRTDAGVHAAGNVVSLRAERLLPAAAINRRLPRDLAVLAADEAADGFDARADARARSYVYRLNTAPAPDPLRARYELHHPRPLDLEALAACAAALVETHDFTAFTPTETEHVFFERTVLAAAWRREGDRVEFAITAHAFLRHMVRVLVGTMLERPDPQWMSDLLGGRPRSAAGRTAPAHGLTLTAVDYDRAPPKASQGGRRR